MTLDFQMPQIIYYDNGDYATSGFYPPLLMEIRGGRYLQRIFGSLLTNFGLRKVEKIVIYGMGPFAKLMHFYFSADSQYQVVAFTVDEVLLREDGFCGKPVVAFERIEERYPSISHKMFVAVGYNRMRNRKLMFDKAKAKGYQLVNYISSQATTHDDLQLGENNVLMASVNIEPFITIGDNNIIWSNTLLCHDLTLGNHNYFAPKCLISGNVTIRDLCFFGSGVILIDNLTIADETYLRAGSVLFQNTQQSTQYAGNPARVIKIHEETGIIIQR